MATRLYPAVRVPGAIIHGRPAGTWVHNSVYSSAQNPSQYTWRLSPVNTDCGTLTALNIKCNQQGNHDLFWTRWMTAPLEAVTLSGTLELCFKLRARWNNDTSFTTDSDVQVKVHAFIAVGESATVRTTIIDNSVDAAELHHATSTWQSIVNSVSGSVLAGDCIVIELGFRIVSSPTPTPTLPEPSKWTEIDVVGTGATAGGTDAVAGTTTSSRNAWLEFSTTLTEQAAPAAHANDTCALAETIPPTLPFDTGFVVTKGSAESQKPAWYVWTAPASGRVIATALGTNYACQLQVFTGGLASCGTFTSPGSFSGWSIHTPHRSNSGTWFDAVSGTTYRFRLQNATGSTNAVNSGGVLRLRVFYQGTPQADDVFLPNGQINVWRTGGAIVNLTADLFSSAPTGIAFDWTQAEMEQPFLGGTHADYRALIGTHDFDLVEILDAATLNLGEAEIDFINDPIQQVPGQTNHPATMHVTRDGYLYLARFGNGYGYVVGTGSLPSILDRPPQDPTYVAIMALLATKGDNQTGAPFGLDNAEFPLATIAAPWVISIDESTGDIYYVDASIYVPAVGPTMDVRKLNVLTDVDTVFATITLSGHVECLGLKGLQFLPGGGLLVTNGDVIHRLDASGAIVQTYTPVTGAPDDCMTLCDVKLTTDGQAFWAVDLQTARLYKFDIFSGAELESINTYGLSSTLVQMGIWQPNPPEPPVEPEPEDCVMAVVNLDAPCVNEPSIGCITPYAPGRLAAIDQAMNAARIELGAVES